MIFESQRYTEHKYCWMIDTFVVLNAKNSQKMTFLTYSRFLDAIYNSIKNENRSHKWPQKRRTPNLGAWLGFSRVLFWEKTQDLVRRKNYTKSRLI